MGSLLVVGAGLYGLTVAEHAARYGHHVQVIDQRPHLGGNAWSYPDPVTGIEVHAYGSHIFHTSNDDVWRWVNRYSDWQRYDHRVSAESRTLGIQKLGTSRKGRLSGGMTDFYADGGFIRKSTELVRVHPDCCRTEVRYNRVHHVADFSGFTQQLIRA